MPKDLLEEAGWREPVDLFDILEKRKQEVENPASGRPPATEISQGREPGFMDRVFRLFENPEKEQAKAVQALVDADLFKIAPSDAYRYRDAIDEGIKLDPQRVAASSRTTAMQRVSQALEIGGKQRELGFLGNEFIMSGDPKWLDLMRQVKMPEQEFIPEGRLESAFLSAAKMFPIMAHTAVESTKAALTSGMIVGGAAAATGPAAPISVPAGFAAGAMAGGSYAAYRESAKIEGGLALAEIINMKDEAGRPIDPNIARAVAFGIGQINGLIEVAQLKTIAKSVPGIKSLFSKAVVETLASKTLKEKLISLAGTYAKHMTTETGQEIAQESTNIVFEELGKRLNNMTKGTNLNPTTVDAVVSRLRDTGIEAAKGFSVMLAPGTVTSAAGAVAQTAAAKSKASSTKTSFKSAPGLDGIGRFESGNNYQAEHPTTGAKGKYQIMPGNWPVWAQEAGLGEDAEMTAENQETVAQFKWNQYMERFDGNDQLAATAWFAGPGAAARLANGDTTVLNRKDANGVTVSDYIQRTTGREFGAEGAVQGPIPVNIDEVIRRAVETDEDINTIIDEAFGPSVESDSRVEMAAQNLQNTASEETGDVQATVTFIPGTNETQASTELIPAGAHPLVASMAREAFTNVKGITVEERKDGTYIKGANGAEAKLTEVDHISPNEAVVKLSYGEARQGGQVAGSYQDGEIRIVRGVGDRVDLAHESIHWMEDIGILTPEDVKTIQKHIQKQVSSGKLRTVNENDIGGPEDRAAWLAQQLTSQAPNTAFSAILQKVRDFITALANAVGFRTAQGVVRDIKTGKVWENIVNERPADAQYSIREVGDKEFVVTPEGDIDFGYVSQEIGNIIKRQAGPIRLEKGTEDFGQQHIEARRGKDIQEQGYHSTAEFVEDMARNYTAIYAGRGRDLILVKREGKNQVAYIELKPGPDGDYYTVNTGLPIARDAFLKNKTPLWEGAQTLHSSITGSPLRGLAGQSDVNRNIANVPDSVKGGKEQYSLKDEKDGIIKDATQQTTGETRLEPETADRGDVRDRVASAYNQAETQATAELKARLAKAEKALATARKNKKESAAEKAAERVKAIKTQLREVTGQARRTGEEKTVTDYQALKETFRQAARAAREAYRSGNKEGVEKAKGQMKEATQTAREKRQVADKRLNDINAILKLTKMKGSIAVDYQKRIRDLMSDFDPKNITDAKWGELQALQEYIDKNGVPLGINPKRLAELKRLTDIPLKSLTDEQLAVLRQQLEQLTALGKLKARMKWKYNQRKRYEILNRILATTVNLDPSVTFDKGQLGHLDKLKVGALSFYLNTLHTPRVADMADGRRDYKGEQAKLIRVMGEGETAAVTNAMKRQQGWLDWLKENGISLPEEGSESDVRMMVVIRVREGAMKAAQKLMDAHGMKTVPVLTSEEEAIVGYIRDDMERNKARLAATWEEVNEEIFPEQKVYYLPLKYEGEEELLPEAQTEGRGRTTHTFQGFGHKRKINVDKLPRVGIARLYHEATMEQEWFTGLQPVIEDIRSVVMTPDYKAEAGQVLYDWWKTQLDIMARRGWTASAQMNAVSSALASIRHNIASATLAFKLPTVIMQPFAVFDAMAFVNGQLGPVAAAKVAGAVTESFLRPGWAKSIIEGSVALQQRAAGELAIQEELARLDSSFMDKAKKVGFDLIQWTDLKTAAAVQEQVRRILVENGMDEAKAKADAEFAMHMSQGSTSVAYRPHILAQGEAARTIFTFQNFVMNRWGILIHDVIMGKIVHGSDFKARFLGVLSLGILVAGGMAEDEARRRVRQLYSNPKEDKRSIFEQVAVNTLGLVPFFGTFITAASQKYSALPPSASHVQKLLEGGFQAMKGKDAKSKVKGAVKASESLLTFAFGIPGTGQVFDLIEGAMSDKNGGRGNNQRRK